MHPIACFTNWTRRYQMRLKKRRDLWEKARATNHGRKVDWQIKAADQVLARLTYERCAGDGWYIYRIVPVTEDEVWRRRLRDEEWFYSNFVDLTFYNPIFDEVADHVLPGGKDDERIAMKGMTASPQEARLWFWEHLLLWCLSRGRNGDKRP